MIDSIIHAVLGILATVLAGVAVTLARGLAKKFNYDLQDKQAEAIKTAAREGILYAEEWAARKAKAGEIAVKGADKLKVASAYVVQKIPNVSPLEAEDIVHASLSAVGQGAAVSLGKLSAAIES